MKKISIVLAAFALAGSGCATKDYVHEYVGGQVSPVNQRIDAVDGRVNSNEASVRSAVQELNRRADGVENALKEQAGLIDNASRTAHEALDRANAAGKLAEGKLMYEVVMSDDTLKFSLEDADLSDAAKQQLDVFAAQLKAQNRNVYIEIQGHTDTTGSAAYNLKLGAQRAEMVKRYLNMTGGIPLHRMATISYGESAPVADNKTRAGREQNRRVVLVVLN
jgi:outer membrane protein OmpA-like peptidoglycan-associated protein